MTLMVVKSSDSIFILKLLSTELTQFVHTVLKLHDDLLTFEKCLLSEQVGGEQYNKSYGCYDQPILPRQFLLQIGDFRLKCVQADTGRDKSFEKFTEIRPQFGILGLSHSRRQHGVDLRFQVGQLLQDSLPELVVSAFGDPQTVAILFCENLVAIALISQIILMDLKLPEVCHVARASWHQITTGTAPSAKPTTVGQMILRHYGVSVTTDLHDKIWITGETSVKISPQWKLAQSFSTD